MADPPAIHRGEQQENVITLKTDAVTTRLSSADGQDAPVRLWCRQEAHLDLRAEPINSFAGAALFRAPETKGVEGKEAGSLSTHPLSDDLIYRMPPCRPESPREVWSDD